MRQFTLPGLSLLILLFLAACGLASGANGSGPVQALADYLTALVGKDEARLTALTCPRWQPDALLELDAFQAVETTLEGLSCRQVGSDGEAVLAGCQGKILARYVNETQEFNLGERTYRLEKNGEAWQVCGYTLK